MERVFEHAATETLVAFSMMGMDGEDAPIRGSDFTSVETRLDQCGLIDGSLADAIREFWETRAR